MSKIEELLRKKREAQIRRMEGEPDLDAERSVERALDKVRKKTKGKKRKKKLGVDFGRINFSNHAKKRMAQRGMQTEDIYTIWRACEPYTQTDGRSVYEVDHAALDHAAQEDKEILKSWIGCAIIIDERFHTPLLITILASGKDTRTQTGRRKRPNRRWRD